MRLRVLAIPYGHALSHVSRPLLVAEELRARGHDVLFAGGGKELAHPRRSGFEVREILELPHEVLFGRIRSRRLRFVEGRELDALIEADRKILDALKPDLLLTDGRVSARLSATLAGVRHVAIVNVSSTHHRAMPYAPLFDWLRSARLRRRLAPINVWFEKVVFDAAVPAFRQARRRLGVTCEVTATNCLEGNDLTLLPDIPEFMPSQGLPANHVYVGPLTFRSDLPEPGWWPELLRRKASGNRIVYLTLGTTGTREVFEAALRATASAQDCCFVVSTGGQFDLDDNAGNIFAADYLDGDRIMKLADAVVCHGGNGTIYQALTHGVPVIGIPTIPDQAYNMRCAATVGAGVTLAGALTPAKLERALARAGAAATRARDWAAAAAPWPSLAPVLPLVEDLGLAARAQSSAQVARRAGEPLEVAGRMRRA